MRILLTGADGQIGGELRHALEPMHDVIATTRSQVDLLDTASILRVMRDVKPRLVINAAGYTTVDRAEREPELALAINGAAVGVIGDECRRIGAAVIHYSTDYVFDGTAAIPYVPSSPTNPVSAYGRSKLAGEIALRDSGAEYLILRACWVYGVRGNNFLNTMLRLGADRPELRIVNDQTGCPTWSREIANATAAIINASSQGGTSDVRFPGDHRIHHLASAGQTTWFEFARHIFEFSGTMPPPRLVPITTAQYGASAQRPAFSVLDCSSATETFGVRLPDWRDSLRAVMAELRAAPSLTPPSHAAPGNHQGD